VRPRFVKWWLHPKTTIAYTLGVAKFLFSGAVVRTKGVFTDRAGAWARLFTQDCLLCTAVAHGVLCGGCNADLPRRLHVGCLRCGEAGFEGQVCGVCLKSPPHFDCARIAYDYIFPFGRLMQAYKFNARLSLTALFADALVRRVRETNVVMPDLIVPMPLAKKRLTERGFNQSALLGRAVAKQLNVRFGEARLLRVRETPPQAGLPREERLKNVKDAFDCKTDLKGLSVALIDDVMTTGATMSEAACALKKQGAARVEAWSISRTRWDRP
jgi:ComF family protein